MTATGLSSTANSSNDDDEAAQERVGWGSGRNLDVAPAIEVHDLSISYSMRIDETSVWGDLRNLAGRRHGKDRIVPALRDVSFTVPKGSVLGVIGRNGAGKSTLLRALAGVLAPEQGQIIVRGRIALFAMGLGFNANLTGRENIQLGGLAIGLTRKRINELAEEIADFADLGEFIDYPMKTYSTGMKGRLGFSVASHLDPDILLIDEALAGGDASFKDRCTNRMNDMCREGKTIVLVTHGLSSVSGMATDGLWMHQGRVMATGDPDEVVAKYMRHCRIEDMGFDDE